MSPRALRRALAPLALAGILAAVSPAAAGTRAQPASAPGAPAARAVQAPAPATDPRALTYAPLTLDFPRPATFRMKNGLVVHLLRDAELPIVDLAFFVRGGSVYDPPGKEGLAGLATHVMRTGGTRAMTPDQVDQALEFLPADIDIDADSDALSGSLSCLKDKFPQALHILAGMLREPRFDEARLATEKARVVEFIRRRWDEPGTIADDTFRLLVYGTRSPWATLSTVDSVGRIGRDDLVDFAHRTLRPGNTLMAVSGDLEPAAMKRLLKKEFGDWSGGPAAPPAIAKVKDTVKPGVHLVERPLPQTTIALGHLGATRFDPDKFPLFVLNYVLGEGGFSSRLMKEVRSDRGLAYSVSGGIGTDSDRGLFEITCRTRSDATVQAIEAIRGVVRRLRDEGPTEAEVRQAKDARLNSFVFTVNGTAPYMKSYLYYEYYGYPSDYLRTWRDKLNAVTRDDVRRAARRLLSPDRMLFVVVGDPKHFDRPLDTLGLGAPDLVTLGEDGGPPAL